MTPRALHCLACDLDFAATGGKGKPRCPRCLRAHGVIDAAPAPSTKHGESKANAGGETLGGASRGAGDGTRPGVALRRRLVLPLAALFALAATALAVRLLRSTPAAPPDQPGVEPLEAVDEALAAAGISRADRQLSFAPDDAIRAFAQSVASSGDDRARAEALARTLSGLLAAHGTPLAPGSRRPCLPRTASVLLAALEAGEAGSVGSYEAAALALACARSVGLIALPAEVHQVAVAEPFADPGGVEGRFIVVVNESRAADAPALAAIDPSSGASDDVHDRTLFSDVAFAGRFYAERALAELAQAEPSAALRDVDRAQSLDTKDPDVLATRGLVELAAGDANGAVVDWQAAVVLRDDPPHRAGLGEALVAAGRLKEGRRALEAALQADASLPAAHLDLARIDLARRDLTAAERELAAATKDGASAGNVALVEAAREELSGDRAGAEQSLRALLASASIAPLDRQRASYALYGLLVRAGHRDEARTVGAALVAMSQQPEVARARLRQLDEVAPPPSSAPASGPGMRAATVRQEPTRR